MRASRRRGIAGCLLLVSLGLAGCGGQQSSNDVPDPDVTAGSQADWYGEDGWGSEPDDLPEGPTKAPGPTTPPAVAPPQLDDTALRAHLDALPTADRSLIDHHLGAPLGEGTWIVAAPMTVEEARLRLLGPRPRPARPQDLLSQDSSAYAFLQVGNGVVAWEPWGFADPPQRLLARLSRDGATSAVVTNNVEAMTRFGYAHDGHVVFDAPEYAFADSISEIPVAVRDLARLAWNDLSGPLVETADSSTVGLAMAEKVTGVRADPAVQDVEGKGNWYAVPMPWGAGGGG